MSRLPPISPRDLRDHADPERIERIWERVRVEAQVAGAAAPRAVRPAKTGRALLLVAAALGLLGAGIGIGVSVSDADRALVRETAQAPLADVFATGTKERSFALPGGGKLLLERDSLVEVVELRADQVTLSLLRGSAVVDATELSVMVVAGEARVAAPAGSSVALARRDADVDVLVSQGSVEVTSPAGHHVVGRGQALAHVPTVKVVSARVDPQEVDPVQPTPVSPTARPTVALHSPPEIAPTPVVEPIAVAPSWLVLAGNTKYEDAFDALEQGAGLEATIQNAQSARELMLLVDIAGAKKKLDLRVRALRRVADEFSSDPNASAAAMELSLLYDKTDKALASKYRDLASRASAFKEPVLCRELRELSPDAKGEYDAAAVAKASEYLAKFPGASCDDDAREIVGHAAKQPTPTPSSSAEPAPSASASGASTAAPPGKSSTPAPDKSASPSPPPEKQAPPKAPSAAPAPKGERPKGD